MPKLNFTSKDNRLAVKNLDTGQTLDGIDAIQVTTEDGKPYVWIGFANFEADVTLGVPSAATTPATTAPAPAGATPAPAPAAASPA